VRHAFLNRPLNSTFPILPSARTPDSPELSKTIAEFLHDDILSSVCKKCRGAHFHGVVEKCQGSKRWGRKGARNRFGRRAEATRVPDTFPLFQYRVLTADDSVLRTTTFSVSHVYLAAYRRSNTAFPPRYVACTAMSLIWSTGHVRMSLSRMMKSASLPGSSDPFCFSSNVR